MTKLSAPSAYAVTAVLAAATVFMLGFRAGLRTGIRRAADVPPTVAARVSELGIKAQRFSRGGRDYALFYAPAGLSLGDGLPAESMAYVAAEVEYSASVEKLLSRALSRALAGPPSGAGGVSLYPLVSPSARVNKISFSGGRLGVDFSREFSPGGGSAAMLQARYLAEETARQFADVREVVITVDGRSDALEP